MIRNLLLAILLGGSFSLSAQDQNGVLREVYLNIPGTLLADLTNNASYPNSPSFESILTDSFEAPTDVLETYGQRLQAYIVPPTSGNYYFWIASDDAGALFLSTNENPSNKRLIANVNGWTPPRLWTREVNQKSAAITLTASQKYFIEAIMKEGGGGDNLAVQWQLPNGTVESPIPASRLLVYGLSAPMITQQPANTSVSEGGVATFSIQVARGLGMTYQWEKNGQNISGANSSTLTMINIAVGDNGSRFRCLLSNPQGSTASAEAILTVTRDLVQPTLISVSNMGDAQTLTLLFSELVEASTATNASNYAIEGIPIYSALFAGDNQTIMLKTGPLQVDTPYSLIVNNIRDRATTPNTIAPNSKISFSISFNPLDPSFIYGKNETAGPSSRRTCLAITEIMYHPLPRLDGKNLEFIELFNSNPWPENIGGYRISGDIEFVFPSNAVIPGRGYVVLAAVSNDLAVVYNLQNVVGSFANSLPNDKGTIRLRNQIDALLLEVNYSSASPFPASADGGGHSLVLARPSYGEGNYKAWSASDLAGGSPGLAESPKNHPFPSVTINEILAHTDEPQTDYIELYNYSATPVNLGGCILTDNPTTNKFVMPADTILPAKGFLYFEQNQLGFALSSEGETIYLYNPDKTRVIDSLKFGPQANGSSYGRYPDGTLSMRELTRLTPGAANSPPLIRDIVINEIMYHPISGNSDEEFVELHNRGSLTVNLGGWRLAEGIEFTIPSNTAIEPGGYLVIAKNVQQLTSLNTHLTPNHTLGNYEGNLSNQGERICLTMPHPSVTTNSSGIWITNWIDVVVDEVTYRDGGQWGRWSDGGGSSLELVDTHADHRLGPNWADSDESTKSEWKTIEFTGMLDNGNGSADQFQMFLQGEGECLVDEVQVFVQGGANLINNGGFDSGMNGWYAQGSQDDSSWEAGSGYNGSGCLHVRASGRGDTGANRIRTALSTVIAQGKIATLKARVRWLKGNPEILLRLRGNWIEAPGYILTSRSMGTPGQPNSQRQNNAGPAISEVTHYPILPSANQTVQVIARVSDPDGLAALALRYRVDPSTNFSVLNMVSHGAGAFSATLPAMPANSVVAFHIQATDAASPSVTRFYPENVQQRECLIRYGEPTVTGTLGNYRIWLSQKTINRWTSREKNSNKPLDATFVYGNERVIYNANTLYSGSPWHTPGYSGPINGMCDYILEFPSDNSLLGDQGFLMSTVGNLDNDATAQREQIAFWMLQKIGVPSLNRRFIHLFVNGIRRGKIYEDAQQPGSEIIKQWFPQSAAGDLYKIEDWFEFDDSGNSKFFNVDATLQNFTTTGGAKKLARYRWTWRKRAVQDSSNNYTNLFNLVDAANINATDAYATQMNSLVDTEEWMKVFALEHMVGNWDSYGHNRGKNMYAYKPLDGKWQLLAWDIDFLFDMGGDNVTTVLNPTAGNFPCSDPTMRKMMSHPPNLRAYWEALLDLAYGPMLSEQVGAMVDAKYNGLRQNGVSLSSPDSTKSWIQQRRNNILSQANAFINAKFAVTSNSGRDFSTNNNLASLSGTAPLGIKSIEINGIVYPITWTTLTNWNIRVPLQPGVNSLTVRGLDKSGQIHANSQTSLNATYTGSAENPTARLVINEIMYHPLEPDTEFVELFNNSTSSTFDLYGWRLRGVDYDFPAGSFIRPQNYIVIAKDKAAFTRYYGNIIPVYGEFTGQMDRGGETLSLIRPGVNPEEDQIITQVTYDDQAPWPTAADGFGSSLQLVDPNNNNNRLGNWAAASINSAVLATPGAVNSVRANLPEFPPLFLNEIQPENVGVLTDNYGEKDPWIELINMGTSSISLSGFYLSDSETNLNRWAFPAATVLGPGQFLLVWADAQSEQTNDRELHANFRIPSTQGKIVLSRIQNGQIIPFDYLNFDYVTAGRSYGAYPDGQVKHRQVFHYSTPGQTNNPASIHIPITVNEWMANNTSTLVDPADAQYEDWFELHNSGGIEIDVSGYYLTDSLVNSNQFQIPNGTRLAPNGFLLVWADGESNQNSLTNRDLHVNFKLSQAGESIALFAPDGTIVDAINFGVQTNDVSEGRWPDGNASSIMKMDAPTPRTANLLMSSNHPPVWSSTTDKAVIEENLLSFSVSATDPDENQSLTYSLLPGAPIGMSIDAKTGMVIWTPSENQGPGKYIIYLRATDSGIPPLTSTLLVNITVEEANLSPALSAIADQQGYEGQLFQLQVSATDSDLPAQALQYSLESGSPEGMTINPSNGLISWTPTENQAPGLYNVQVRVVDNAQSPATAVQTFKLTVDEVNAPPVLFPIGNRIVLENETLAFQAKASDPDIPIQHLIFSIEDGSLPGASIDPISGMFSWAPSDQQIPSTNSVVIRVADDGFPSWTVSERITIYAVKKNQAPVITQPSDIEIEEGGLYTYSAIANDSDANQKLTFSVATDSPVGMIIDPNSGNIQWTPTEAQGPSTNLITITVSDDGIPALSATASYKIFVKEKNSAPVLAAIPDQTLYQGQSLNIQLAASDIDIPSNQIDYALVGSVPSGMTLSPTTGVISWTPSATQISSVNTITVQASDNGNPSLSDTKTFRVSVLQGSPWNYVSLTGTGSASAFYIYLTKPGDAYLDDVVLVSGTVAEQGANLLKNGYYESSLSGTWTVSANHSRSSIQTNMVHSGSKALYLVATTGGTTSSSSINQTITPSLSASSKYTLSFWYRPGTNANSLVIRLSGYGISVTNTWAAPTNHAPALLDIADQSVKKGETFTIAASASDSDPGQSLVYSLETTAPSGMSINPNTGLITWKPADNVLPGTYSVTVRVTDNGIPAMTDTKLFRVTVEEKSLWQYVTVTGTASASILYLYLDAAGDAYVDDLSLVAGKVPQTGVNLIQNGDFEKPLLDFWNVSSNLAQSAISSSVRYSGQASLHLISSSGGSTRMSSIYQEIIPTLVTNADYTLSFYCLPGSSNSKLTIRLSGTGLGSTYSLVGIVAPTNEPPIIEGITVQPSGSITITWKAEIGVTYQVQKKNTLLESVWSSVGNPIKADKEVMSLTESPDSFTQGYYRIYFE